jgi:DNA-binding HxlR family transcriptional regulator
MIEVGEDELIRLIFDVRQVFRGDWAGPVLVVLRRGSMQYRELRDEMGHYSFFDRWSSKERTLSNSELARTLTRMTQDGLLIRTERPGEWHRAVSYELSVEGRQMIERFTPLLRGLPTGPTSSSGCWTGAPAVATSRASRQTRSLPRRCRPRSRPRSTVRP